MAEIDRTQFEQWASSLESLSKQLRTNAKAILTSGDDPFVCRQHMDRASKLLGEIDLLKRLPELQRFIGKECLEATAEFWQRFCSAANDVGWEVCGSTERRLVSRAFIVELKDEIVSVDGVPGRHSPHVPALINTLKPHIDRLSESYGSLQQFADLLARAYDSLGGHGDIGVETVFRQCVVLMQPSTFWTNVEQSKFKSFPRPAFRYLLSTMLAENTRAADGRELRLTPTVNRKDVWELFSPAEGRVVQVGRLAFKSK